VISEKNPALPKLLKKGISKQAWMKLYVTGEAASWSEIVPGSVNKPVHVYTRSDSCGAASSWAAFLGSKKQEDLKGIGIYGDPGLLEAVKRDPIGVGYNNFSFVFDKAGKVVAGVKLAPIDANNNGSVDPDELIVNREKAIKSIESGNYSVTRNNYLFSKGKPQGLKLAFIEFILSEEGTRVVNKVQASLPFKPAERAKIIKELKENK
jgi:phosphate transport system substrate-binding protein